MDNDALLTLENRSGTTVQYLLLSSLSRNFLPYLYRTVRALLWQCFNKEIVRANPVRYCALRLWIFVVFCWRCRVSC